MKYLLPVLLLLSLTPPLRAQTTSSATAPADPVRQALEAYVSASLAGDAPAMRARMDYHGPLETRLADATVQFQQALAHLRKAATQAFPNQDLSILIGDTPQEARRQIAAAKITVQGDNATVTAQTNQPAQPLHMVRVNGQWKISLIAPVKDWSHARIEQLCDELTHQADIYNALADEVATEKFHAPRQAAEILRQELLKPGTRPTTRP